MDYPKPYRPQQPEDLSVVPPMVYVDKEIIWEYKCLTRNLALGELPTISELNQLGKEGWEVAGMVTYGEMFYCYLKRLA